MKESIITDRLTLDLLSEDDHDFVRSIVNSPGWIKFIGDRNVHSKDDALAYIQKINSNPDIMYWVARIKDGETPAGIISFIKRTYLDHYDIGFAFLPEFIGKGYAHEAAKEVLDMAITKPEYNCILATTIPANTDSIRLLTKLGFHFSKEIEVENEKLHVYSFNSV